MEQATKNEMEPTTMRSIKEKAKCLLHDCDNEEGYCVILAKRFALMILFWAILLINHYLPQPSTAITVLCMIGICALQMIMMVEIYAAYKED